MENNTAIFVNSTLNESSIRSAIYNPGLVDGTELDMSTISFEEELATGIFKRKRDEETELYTAIYSSPKLKRVCRSNGSTLILAGEFDDDNDEEIF